MEPKYKVNPLTGELQEYVFEYNGILALRNFTARVEDERLILHAADDVNFSILEALVSEVEINGVLYDNPTAAQEALTRLTFNQNRPVLLDKTLKDLILGAVQKVEGKGLSSNDFTNAYKQQLDTLEDYDIELDENTTELKFKKGNNVIKRISLMFLDDEGTKLVYNKANKTLELRDKRDNLLTSIPVSHFVSNIPTSIVVQNGKIKLMAGSEVIGENTISYNDLADKPELNFATTDHTHNWDDIQGKPNNLATTEGVKSAVEGIQIGGRNLVRDTGNFTLSELPYYLQSNFAGNGGVVSETFRGNKVIKLIYNWQGFQCMTTFEDRPMIISFWAKTSKTGVKFICVTDLNVVLSNNKEIISDGEWHRYTITKNSRITTSSSVRKGFVEFYKDNVHIEEVYVSSFKFEYGNTPTDWTPAPEDLDFYKGAVDVSELNTFKVRETGVYSVKQVGGWSTLLNFNSSGSTSSIEFYKSNWSPATRLGVRNSVDNNRFNDDGGKFRDLAWYDDILRAGVECTQNTTLQKEHQNQVIFVTVPCNIELNTIDDLSSTTFRKVFDSGAVTFTCTGKNIIYTGDNAFNGKKGSTAVISRYANDCYIDIRNI